MSESLKLKQENSQEHLEEGNRNNHEYNHVRPSKNEVEAKQTEIIGEARQNLEDISLDSDQTLDKIKEMSSQEENVNQSPKNVNKDLKKAGLQKELSHVRRKMSKPDRIGSKVIHNKGISAVSEGLSKTIVRPSGMLSGAIIALIGTSLYYLFAKSVGIKYNYFIYIILFVGGFILGILMELISRTFKKNRVS